MPSFNFSVSLGFVAASYVIFILSIWFVCMYEDKDKSATSFLIPKT